MEGSRDAGRWERRFGVLDDGAIALRLEFPPVTVRALRVVLPAGAPMFDWSINELAVYGGE